MASLAAWVRCGQIDIPPLVRRASDDGLERSGISELSSVIFVTRLASLTDTDRVFIPGEPVKSSFDLVERTPYAKVSSGGSFMAGPKHVLH